MPKGVYERTPEQLERLREMGRPQGAKTRPSQEARDRMAAERLQHGHNKRGARSAAYSRWRNMLSRCENPNVPAYKNYGGRGIKVCEPWHEFKNFLADMGEPPPGLTLERIDNDGNYEPGNCRWATYKEQRANQRAYRRR
jgi:hypothetical protein